MRAVIADIPPHWLHERKISGADQGDEVWEGVLHIPPSPTIPHQSLKGQLGAYLLYNWGFPHGNYVEQQVNLTTPQDEAHWISNYRIPDLVLLKPKNFHIDKIEYMVGAPDVVVEVRSPGDESYEKLPFYAGLGIPEVWIIDRDTKTPEIHLLTAGGDYEIKQAEANGWNRSDATRIEMKRAKSGKLAIRLKGKPGSKTEIPR